MTQADYKTMLKALKKELIGHYGEIASRANVSVPTVSKMLNGKINSDVHNILNIAIELRDELRIKREQRLLRLSKQIMS